MNELLTAAQGYAGFGWPVFPVGSDKAPLVARGFKAATRDPRLIAEWWRQWPQAGIGLAIPEGLVVFDIDPRNGGRRPTTLPPTRESGTRSGGAHLYYSVPSDLTFAGQFDVGIDIKAAGKGYVILPPTPGYQWTRRGPMVDLPIDVLNQVTRIVRTWHESEVPGTNRQGQWLPWEHGTRYGVVALEARLDAVRHADNGERNNTLFKAACSVARLIAGGELAEESAMKQLFEAGLGTGLDAEEVVQCLESGYEHGIGDPRRAPA